MYRRYVMPRDGEKAAAWSFAWAGPRVLDPHRIWPDWCAVFTGQRQTKGGPAMPARRPGEVQASGVQRS